MRRVLTSVALLLASLALSVGRSGAEVAECFPGSTGSARCHQEVTVEAPGRPASSGGERQGRADPDYVSLPWVVKAGDPGMCTTLTGNDPLCSPSGRDLPAGTPDCIRAMGIGPAPGLKDYARERWQEASATHRMCPSAANGTESLDPTLIAIRAWQDIPLPAPTPHIAPGWAITGKYAYLETNGARSHTYTTDTPLGPLTLEASGRYYVDWGDGTTDGPYTVEGRPWPEGEITHTYIDVGRYDVVVTEEWSATWSLGGTGGELGGMRTQGRIPGFRVEQIQVVVGP